MAVTAPTIELMKTIKRAMDPNGVLNPGKVFDLELPLSQVAEAYKAMDERRAIKALLRP